MNNKYLDIDRDELVSHALKILNHKNLKGTYIAQETDINQRQIYNFRNGHRDIKQARLETLIKFENLYQRIKNKL
ncbi:hypothetical protein [Staphylococcus aureus]|uniref:hypothetical protein n=1 Tax=Staphylococcus aureus TaxID=1280 RepID=UPI001BFE3DB3|nr:hypothetical protein [Staphylococcus aureus]